MGSQAPSAVGGAFVGKRGAALAVAVAALTVAFLTAAVWQLARSESTQPSGSRSIPRQVRHCPS